MSTFSQRLSDVQAAQLRRLFRAAANNTDPERTGVGRLALQAFEQGGLIEISGAGKGKRVTVTAKGLQALMHAKGTSQS